MLSKSTLVAAATLLLSACATVRQQDLNAWVGVPVEALDTHSLFLTIPMVRKRTDSGIEIRNYANGRNFSSCSASGSANANSVGYSTWVTGNAFSSCSSGWTGCNNIFYIRDGKVLEYAPTGRCYTNESVQPQARYKRF